MITHSSAPRNNVFVGFGVRLAGGRGDRSAGGRAGGCGMQGADGSRMRGARLGIGSVHVKT
jgi:hypothetical protein